MSRRRGVTHTHTRRMTGSNFRQIKSPNFFGLSLRVSLSCLFLFKSLDPLSLSSSCVTASPNPQSHNPSVPVPAVYLRPGFSSSSVSSLRSLSLRMHASKKTNKKMLNVVSSSERQDKRILRNVCIFYFGMILAQSAQTVSSNSNVVIVRYFTPTPDSHITVFSANDFKLEEYV